MRGTDVRRFRRSIGLNQADFAGRFGVSQSALSRLESGRIMLSDEHLRMLEEAFDSGVSPTFAEFRRATRESEAGARRALEHERYILQTVWDWEEGFDLASCPSPDLRAGVVTIPMTDRATIAFKMPRVAGNWHKGETLVFEECGFNDLRPGDACLVQYQRDQGPVTSLAVAETQRSVVRLRGVGARSLQIPEESLIIVLRATIRILNP